MTLKKIKHMLALTLPDLRCFDLAVIVGGGRQARWLRQALLSVVVLRFAGKVALWLGRGFTTVPVSSLTLHSRGTGR